MLRQSSDVSHILGSERTDRAAQVGSGLQNRGNGLRIALQLRAHGKELALLGDADAARLTQTRLEFGLGTRSGSSLRGDFTEIPPSAILGH
jgi:hypothetical protein